MTRCETMEEDKMAMIYSYEDDKIYNISYNDNTTIEDLCIKVVQNINIQQLFSIQNVS